MNRAAVFVLLVTLALLSCSSTPKKYATLPKGKIAVVTSQYIPKTNFGDYSQGKDTMQGAASGAALGAIAPLEAGPYGIVLYPVIAPFTILAGSLAGSAAGATSKADYRLTDEERLHKKGVEEAIHRAIENIDIQNEIAKLIEVDVVSKEYDVALIDGVGPDTPEEQPDYPDLRDEGYAAILEISALKTGFETVSSSPPRLSLLIIARARVIDLSGQGISGHEQKVYTSYPRSIEDWKEGNGLSLMEEYKKGYVDISNYFQLMLFD